mgnify:CR=1 FL=1
MNERLKELRNYLGLSQEAFGETVGVTKAAISRIESGINSLSDRMILSIVTQHNVSEEWLRTGNGSMFNAMSEDEDPVQHDVHQVASPAALMNLRRT